MKRSSERFAELSRLDPSVHTIQLQSANIKSNCSAHSENVKENVLTTRRTWWYFSFAIYLVRSRIQNVTYISFYRFQTPLKLLSVLHISPQHIHWYTGLIRWLHDKYFVSWRCVLVSICWRWIASFLLLFCRRKCILPVETRTSSRLEKRVWAVWY